jgi:hypothetical protein
MWLILRSRQRWSAYANATPVLPDTMSMTMVALRGSVLFAFQGAFYQGVNEFI